MPLLVDASSRLAKARLIHGQAGQSLVELAISLPVLLLMILGLADIGRAFYYTSAIANAAREGAIFASRQPTFPSNAAITQHACNETGFAAYGSSCPGFAATSTCTGPCATASDVTVEVTYDLKLMTAFMAARILPANADTIHLRAASKFPIVGQ